MCILNLEDLYNLSRCKLVAVLGYFPLRMINEKAPGTESYAYEGQGKVGTSNEAHINGIYPFLSTDKRHFVQQCEYTICSIKINSGDTLYVTHEFALKGSSNRQDRLVKYLLPVSERSFVLETLDKMNINAYSLYQTEDALMRTLGYRELEKNINYSRQSILNLYLYWSLCE